MLGLHCCCCMEENNGSQLLQTSLWHAGKDVRGMVTLMIRALNNEGGVIFHDCYAPVILREMLPSFFKSSLYYSGNQQVNICNQKQLSKWKESSLTSPFFLFSKSSAFVFTNPRTNSPCQNNRLSIKMFFLKGLAAFLFIILDFFKKNNIYFRIGSYCFKPHLDRRFAYKWETHCQVLSNV